MERLLFWSCEWVSVLCEMEVRLCFWSRMLLCFGKISRVCLLDGRHQNVSQVPPMGRRGAL